MSKKTETAATAPAASKNVRNRKPAAPQQLEAPATVVAEAVAPVTAGTRKIEKNRPTQNGVTRPSAGGLCRDVWDFCESSGELPTVAQVKAHAASKGWNINNASIEYYQYRKYMGIRGRATKAPEASATA